MKITKLAGKVQISSDDDKVIALLDLSCQLSAHPKNENWIVAKIDTLRKSTSGLIIDVTEVTSLTPNFAFANRDELLTILGDNFFFKSVTVEPDPDVALIKAKTDNLPASPASEVTSGTINSNIGAKTDSETQTVGNTFSVFQYLKGLLNKCISIFNEIETVEHHLHGCVFGFGLAATPNGEIHRADRAVGNASPFTLTSGSSAMGAWVQIFGSSDTPVFPGKTFFDINKFLITGASDANQYVVQISWGESANLAAQIAAGNYSEFGFVRESATVIANTNTIQMPRLAAGTKVWARCSCNRQNAKTMTFYCALHEY